MNKPERRWKAHSIVYMLIQSYLDDGGAENELGDGNLEAIEINKNVERIQRRHISGEIKFRRAMQRRKLRAEKPYDPPESKQEWGHAGDGKIDD